MTFKRDYHKYLVLKQDDLAYLDDRQEELLRYLFQVVEIGRKREGKKSNSYVVVNEDEPYAEDIWYLIEQFEEAEQIRDKVQADPKLKQFFEKWVY